METATVLLKISEYDGARAENRRLTPAQLERLKRLASAVTEWVPNADGTEVSVETFEPMHQFLKLVAQAKQG